jgi:cell division protein FtsW
LNGDSFFFFKKQLFFLLVGMAGMIIAAYVPFMLIKRLAWIFYGVAVLCTILVLIIGKEANGSTRWIVIGPIQFQPAELAKAAIALFLSVKVEQYQNTITSKRTFLKLLLLLLIPTVCVLTQNLSSAVIIAFIGLVIMFVGGCRFRYFVYLFAVVVAAFFVFIVLPAMIPLESFPKFMQGFLADFMYRSNRVEAYLDPFKYAQGIGYQTVQSLYAIGSGGIFGAGLGESIQKLGFIPEAYNDIIFAVICEELGLFGATIVLLLFGILIKQGIRIAMNAPDRYMSYVAVGFTAQVGIQAIMNVAVNTNTIPATGASLPFISYGGTAMILLLCSMGVLLNISRYTRNIENIGSKPAAAE